MKLYHVGVCLNTLVWAPKDIEQLDDDTMHHKLTNILLTTESSDGLLYNELNDSLEVGIMDSFDFDHYVSLDELIEDLPESWVRSAYPLHSDMVYGIDRDMLPSIEELWRQVYYRNSRLTKPNYPICPYCGSNHIETIEIGVVPRMSQLHCDTCKASSPCGTIKDLEKYWRGEDKEDGEDNN